MLVGVISDTHGLLRPEALDAMRGCDRILHAGDVGNDEILERLREVAPVTAVRGNVDLGPWAAKLPLSELVEVEGVSIYILHDISQLDLKPEAVGIRVVVFGHSHKPTMKEKNGALYFNPGSAGPRRFSLPVSVGKLFVQGADVQAELVTLNVTR